MSTRIEETKHSFSSQQKKEEKPIKRFSLKEDEEKPIAASPLNVFQTLLQDHLAPIETTASVHSIDELFFTLCNQIDYTVSNGIETTTLLLDGGHGEITLQKYDTAPMEIAITFALSEAFAAEVAAHIPSLSNRLSQQFEEIDFSIQTRLYTGRSEEKKYTVKGNTLR